jgi:hypothetical protein
MVRPRALAVLRLKDKFELGRPLDREVGRLLTLENAPSIDASLVEPIAEACCHNS